MANFIDKKVNNIFDLLQEILSPILSGHGFPGGLLLIVAIIFIIIIIAIDKGVRGAVEDLHPVVYKILDYGGTLGVILFSFLAGIMLTNRWNSLGPNKTI